MFRSSKENTVAVSTSVKRLIQAEVGPVVEARGFEFAQPGTAMPNRPRQITPRLRPLTPLGTNHLGRSTRLHAGNPGPQVRFEYLARLAALRNDRDGEIDALQGLLKIGEMPFIRALLGSQLD